MSTQQLSSALHVAACYNEATVVKVLVDRGSSVHQVDKVSVDLVDAMPCRSCAALTTIPPRAQLGQTPLHVAAARGHLEATNALLKRGARANDRDVVRHPNPCYPGSSLVTHKPRVRLEQLKRTALHVARAQGHSSVADALLEHGANAEAADDVMQQWLHHSTVRALTMAAPPQMGRPPRPATATTTARPQLEPAPESAHEQQPASALTPVRPATGGSARSYSHRSHRISGSSLPPDDPTPAQ